MQKSADHFYRKIAMDIKAPVKTRLEALQEIERPSATFLRTLLRSANLPAELALVAAQALELALVKKDLAKGTYVPSPPSQTNSA